MGQVLQFKKPTTKVDKVAYIPTDKKLRINESLAKINRMFAELKQIANEQKGEIS